MRGVRIVHGDDVGLAAKAVVAVVVGDRPHALCGVDLVARMTEEGDGGAAARVAGGQRQAVERGELYAQTIEGRDVLRAARPDRTGEQGKGGGDQGQEGNAMAHRTSLCGKRRDIGKNAPLAAPTSSFQIMMGLEIDPECGAGPRASGTASQASCRDE